MKKHVLILCLLGLCLWIISGNAWASPGNLASDSDSTVPSGSAIPQAPVASEKAPTEDAQWPAISNALGMNDSELDMSRSEDLSVNAPSQMDQKCAFMPCLKLVDPVDDVYYTVRHHTTVAQIAPKWGVPAAVIMALNPGLTLESTLEPGQKLLADARLPSGPEPYSRGKTNRGRISNARPMPEGEGYFLRTAHPNSWGTDNTVRALMTMFAAYHEKYPEGPEVNMGDISRRRGGRLRPHKSHQAGRDVDFGFVHTIKNESKHPESFIRADDTNLDIEKTWFLIESLIRTGEVKVIYVDIRVQKMLYQYAAPKLTPEQREVLFSVPRRETSSAAIFQHWPGHRNHFHVRFRCPAGQLMCRE